MKKANSWIATDFEDGDDDDDFFAAVAEKVSFGRHGSLDSSLAEQQTNSSSKRPRKRGRNGGDVSLSFIQEEDNSYSNKDEMWCHRHAPKSASRLAVHHKKIEEVRSWMQNELSSAKQVKSSSGILVLRGPPGCGKSATVRALANGMGLAIQEWMPPSELVAFKKDEGEVFKNCEESSRAGDTVQYVSQTKAFRDFLLRAKRYGVLSGQLGENNVVNRQKIVLLEELPGFALRNPSEFHSILSAYSSGKGQRHPLLIVATESNKSNSNSSKGPLNEEAVRSLGADVITFNPAAVTNLVKALKSVAENEAASSPIKMTKIQIPDKDTLSQLAEISGGDIRGAINALQFACLKGSVDIDKCFASTSNLTASSSKKSASKKRGAKGKTSKTNGETPSLASVGGRDPALDLFHALGKVLYCKREEGATATKPFMTKTSLPALLFEPEEVLERAPTSPESFTCFLHQNYPTFFSSVDDLARGAEFLSLADQLFVEWTTTGKFDLSEYGGLIAVRGLCASNKSVVRQGGMKVFRKPDFYERRRASIQRAEQLDYFSSRFQTFGSRAEAATDLVPFISRYCPNQLPSDLREIGIFPGIFRAPFTVRHSTDIRLLPDSDVDMGEAEDEAEDFAIDEDSD